MLLAKMYEQERPGPGYDIRQNWDEYELLVPSVFGLGLTAIQDFERQITLPGMKKKK